MWRNQDGRNNENYFDGEISVQNIKFKGMAGVAGFEPTIARPKPAALPLGYTPNFLNIVVKFVNLIKTS